MKLRLDTVILFVRDVDKLKSFYTNILMLECIEELETDWVLLSAGNCQIGLHKIGEQYFKKNDGALKSESNTKIVFELDEDLVKVRERLIDQQVLMKEIKTFSNYNYWLCDGEDPEGNIFQLKQKKATVI